MLLLVLSTESHAQPFLVLECFHVCGLQMCLCIHVSLTSILETLPWNAMESITYLHGIEWLRDLALAYQVLIVFAESPV